MRLEQQASFILGRRLALLVALHFAPRTLQALYADAITQGYVVADDTQSGSGEPPDTWRYSFYADLEVLRAAGLDIYFDRRANLYKWSNSPFGLSLSEEHLAALKLAQQTFSGHTFPYAVQIRSMLAYLSNLLPREQTEKLAKLTAGIYIQLHEAESYEQIDKQMLDRIGTALRTGRQLEFKYLSTKHGEARPHCITPSELLYKDGHVYLTGWRDNTRGVALFRFTRIVPATLHVSGATARQPFVMRHTIMYTLAASVAAGGVSERFADQQVEWQPDGSALVTAHTADLWEAHRVLLSYGQTSRVLAPPELVEMMRVEVEGMTGMYK
jgi:predicted DNA-binding transcriptional regulator YafY